MNLYEGMNWKALTSCPAAQSGLVSGPRGVSCTTPEPTWVLRTESLPSSTIAKLHFLEPRRWNQIFFSLSVSSSGLSTVPRNSGGCEDPPARGSYHLVSCPRGSQGGSIERIGKKRSKRAQEDGKKFWDRLAQQCLGLGRHLSFPSCSAAAHTAKQAGADLVGEIGCHCRLPPSVPFSTRVSRHYEH